MIETLNKHIDQDLANNHIAVWHDESHLNWYYNTYKPQVILPPAYCYPDHYTYHTTPHFICVNFLSDPNFHARFALHCMRN